MGDINAKHSRWNEPDNNTRGILFDELLLEEDIALLNENQKTHYSAQHNSYSLIDLSICTTDCCPDFTCSVVDDLYGSDHFPVIIEKIDVLPPSEPTFRFKTEKADWNKFKNGTEH